VPNSNLAQRLLTAAIAVPLLLALLFWGPAWGFALVVLGACTGAALELFRMTHPDDRVAQLVGTATTAAAAALLYLYAADARVVFSVLIGVTLLGLLVPLWRLGDIASAALRITAGIAAPLYVGGLIATLALLRRDFGPGHVLMTLMFAWFADTGGYFFGRFLGKRQLYARISPKKTRAGFVGALLGAVIGGLLGHFWFLTEIPLLDAVVLGLICGALGQLGDLVESLLKRSTGLKDSGSILPGHGGLFDRIDALLVASPIVYLYWIWNA
jgi:phosphatidate cytidylyltransferase